MNEVDKARLTKQLKTLKSDDDLDIRISQASIFGRTFLIEERLPEGFTASELKPTGILYFGGEMSDGNNFSSQYSSAILETFKTNPNGLQNLFKELDIDNNTVCAAGGGFSVGTIFHASLEDAIEAITTAVENNKNVKECLTTEEMEGDLSPSERKTKAINEVDESIAYWQANLMDEPDTPSLLTDKRNMFGSSLSEDSKNAILGYLNAPSLEKWDDIKGILITPSNTIWQMLLRVDPSTPLSGNAFTEENIPQREQITKVLTTAVALHNKECRNRIAELEEKRRALQKEIAGMKLRAVTKGKDQ